MRREDVDTLVIGWAVTAAVFVVLTVAGWLGAGS